MDFQCTHTMSRPVPSLHRESTDSLIHTNKLQCIFNLQNIVPNTERNPNHILVYNPAQLKVKGRLFSHFTEAGEKRLSVMLEKVTG